MPNQGSKIKLMMWLHGFGKLFKVFLNGLIQYKKKKICFIEKQSIYFFSVKGFSKFC